MDNYLLAPVVKNLPINAGDTRDAGSIPGPGRSSGQGMATTPVFLPAKSHGQRNLAGYSPWGCKELDTTERLSFAIVELTEYLCLFPIRTSVWILQATAPSKQQRPKKAEWLWLWTLLLSTFTFIYWNKLFSGQHKGSENSQTMKSALIIKLWAGETETGAWGKASILWQKQNGWASSRQTQMSRIFQWYQYSCRALSHPCNPAIHLACKQMTCLNEKQTV